jgi:hypothetical protein
MNVEETGKVLAMAASVDRWLKGDDMQIVVWTHVLGDFSYNECHGALIEHLKSSDRVSPHDLVKIIRHRRQQHTMSNPGWRGAFGLSIDWAGDRYVEVATPPEIEG